MTIMKQMTLLLLVLLIETTVTEAQEFKTYTYFSNDSISLELDLFTPGNESLENTPMVIFVHGGGFSGGNRTAGHSLAKKLIKNNIACASISYTLYMKNKSFSCDGILSEKVKAIQIAANQLWLATEYLIENSDKFNINTSQIFIAGSSAGGETVLHAAFWNRKQMQLYEQKLSPKFQYAGLISGSGAIMDLNLITPENKIPMMFFHGDSDRTVPYGTAAHHHCSPNSPGWLMLFGSHSIAKHLEDMHGTFQLTTFIGGGHSYAGEYVHKNQKPVIDFIKKVLAGENFMLYEDINTNKNK